MVLQWLDRIFYSHEKQYENVRAEERRPENTWLQGTGTVSDSCSHGGGQARGLLDGFKEQQGSG